MSIDLSDTDRFERRHNGPTCDEVERMLERLGCSSLEELVDQTIPEGIRLGRSLDLPDAISERDLLTRAETLASRNEIYRSFIGMGYHDTVTPAVIRRNVLENPNWYTQYTPYQAEISQGRLEALLNFQTMVIDLTGLEIANASLLDEATAAAEAMMMLNRVAKRQDAHVFFVSEDCHPQTIAVVKTRARPIGVKIVVGDHRSFEFDENVFGALVQYPATDGAVYDYTSFCEKANASDAYVVVSADLLSLALLTPPGEFGADVAVGNTQRFGVPLGYGGPHAAYFATREDFKRQIPGRIIGVTVDANGDRALRMALQTREQHIRRAKATSNICTAQVLLAIMAGMYAVYHGPGGLRAIARRLHDVTRLLARGLEQLGYDIRHEDYFDTLRVEPGRLPTSDILRLADEHRINLRAYDDGSIGVALDETVSSDDVNTLFKVFGRSSNGVSAESLSADLDSGYEGVMARTSTFLEHPVFHRYHSETEMMRYLQGLAGKDLSLTSSMIPLGSCTMKLNAAAELLPITLPGFSGLHPCVPDGQARGYHELIQELEDWLGEITGFARTSFQPNSGASGEYAGLLAIMAYHASRGDGGRDVCLIPESAHGTNPASATMVGMRVVVVATDDHGNVDVEDLRAKARKHADRLAALMITYPSTHGVFEKDVREIIRVVHEHGGQVYLDGANMNAQVGLCRPGDYGADVCHLNLHKTFCIPHGGGGPGMGPICVAEHLVPFLPSSPLAPPDEHTGVGPVSAAPFGSANILVISWAYIALMGGDGLRRATELAILNANYMMARLEQSYPVLYKGAEGRCAHEFLLDLRPFKRDTGISELDVAKRLMDYGYHAPTVSFPVVGTMMIEPTESEALSELDRFCEALEHIREEIREVESGRADAERNLLKEAPHTAEMVASDAWDQPYTRERAAFPAAWTRSRKFWPSVRRVDDVYGDRNLVCACPPIEEYAE
ncbi:MAG: aminomethyl-transferring glycine dehydrogenase [Rhodothermales bacterium]